MKHFEPKRIKKLKDFILDVFAVIFLIFLIFAISFFI